MLLITMSDGLRVLCKSPVTKIALETLTKETLGNKTNS